MHQSECKVKGFTRTEHPMMSPDNSIVFFHQFTCLYRDLTSSRHHPADHADAFREYNRTLCRHLPEFSCKHFISQRKHKCKRDRIRSMRMIDYSVLSVCKFFLHLMVHQMGRKLTRRISSLNKTPANAVVLALIINLDDCQARLRIHGDVPEILSCSRHKKKLTGKSRHICTNGLPGRILV